MKKRRDPVREREELFCDTLDDLREKVANPTMYNLIRCSGLLRQLLLDANSLLNTVNRKHRTKITFFMPIFDATPDPDHPLSGALTYSELPDLIDPDVDDPKAPKAQRSLKDFLGFVPIWSRGAQLTVKDIIRYEAHVRGGVHTGDAKEAGDHAAETLNEFVMYGDRPLSLYHIRGIAKCAIHALTPLEQRIRRGPP